VGLWFGMLSFILNSEFFNPIALAKSVESSKFAYMSSAKYLLTLGLRVDKDFEAFRIMIHTKQLVVRT
jgi:hypothetical protein